MFFDFDEIIPTFFDSRRYDVESQLDYGDDEEDDRDEGNDAKADISDEDENFDPYDSLVDLDINMMGDSDDDAGDDANDGDNDDNDGNGASDDLCVNVDDFGMCKVVK